MLHLVRGKRKKSQEKEVHASSTKRERTAEEIMARQAMALAKRSGEPLIEALEDILKTPAVSQRVELMGGPHQEKEEELLYPSFDYHLDESDPDVIILEGVMNFSPNTIASAHGYSKTIPK